jgi:hypothetical protein
MLWKTEDADIHPVALAIWMLILALVDRLPATIAGLAIRQAGNLCVGDFHIHQIISEKLKETSIS